MKSLGGFKPATGAEYTPDAPGQFYGVIASVTTTTPSIGGGTTTTTPPGGDITVDAHGCKSGSSLGPNSQVWCDTLGKCIPITQECPQVTPHPLNHPAKSPPDFPPFTAPPPSPVIVPRTPNEDYALALNDFIGALKTWGIQYKTWYSGMMNADSKYRSYLESMGMYGWHPRVDTTGWDAWMDRMITLSAGITTQGDVKTPPPPPPNLPVPYDPTNLGIAINIWGELWIAFSKNWQKMYENYLAKAAEEAKAEADRLAAEKAQQEEAARQAQLEANRLAEEARLKSEQEEAAMQAQLEANRLAEEARLKSEQEEAARAEADRLSTLSNKKRNTYLMVGAVLAVAVISGFVLVKSRKKKGGK